MRRSIVAALASAGFLLAPRGVASTGYPEAVRSDLALSYTPGCDLCHRSAAAPVGPADTPFAVSAIARGLVVDDPASLEAALKRMRADGVDSDGDGAQDLDELSWGGDPNHSNAPPDAGQQGVTYGCSTSRRGESGGARAIAIGVCAIFVARRRRRVPARRGEG